MGISYRHLIIKHLEDRPNKIVYLEDLVETLALTRAQIQQSIRQMRLTSDILRDQIQVVDNGRAWMFAPRTSGERAGTTQHTGGVQAAVATLPSSSNKSAGERAVTARPIVDNGNIGRIFEELGDVDGTGEIVVTDEEGKLYKLQPIID